jgi:4-hydroxy-2-oxoheptanedioate aldolase
MTLREMWHASEPTLGAWLTIPSTVSAETAGRAGFDYVCVDNQHGVSDYQVTVTMMQAILLGGGTPIVRVPWNEPGIIGKMLDAGAEGVIVPMVNSAAEAQAVVTACRYPPLGMRSFGPVLVMARVPDHTNVANTRTAVIPMIETGEALNNLDEILSVPGIDAIYVGPADLSLSLGLPPGNNDGQATFDDALATIVAACNRHGVVPGMHSSGALAERRLEQGFRMLTVSGDLLAMRGAMSAELAQARGAASPAANKSVY